MTTIVTYGASSSSLAHIIPRGTPFVECTVNKSVDLGGSCEPAGLTFRYALAMASAQKYGGSGCFHTSLSTLFFVHRWDQRMVSKRVGAHAAVATPTNDNRAPKTAATNNRTSTSCIIAKLDFLQLLFSIFAASRLKRFKLYRSAELHVLGRILPTMVWTCLRFSCSPSRRSSLCNRMSQRLNCRMLDLRLCAPSSYYNIL